MENKKIVMSLGGSLIVPNGVDTDFIKGFVSLIKEYTQKGYRFVIITGGGKLARDFNQSLEIVTSPSSEDLDWMGISVTRANAEFVRICFGDLAYEKVVQNPELIPETDRPIVVGGGWKPGNSSDLAAIRAAISSGSKRAINLSNIDYVYDSDPKINKDAKKIEETTWDSFLALFPDTTWTPGKNSPFDPVASIEAKQNNIEVAVINGKNFESIKNYLDGIAFKGTIIK